MKDLLRNLLARLLDALIGLLVSFVTGVSPSPPRGLSFGVRRKVYYANHNSHGDFVLVWAALPKRWRRRVRPVAGADYWGKGRLRQFVIHKVFNGLLIDRVGNDPQAAVARMSAALSAGSSLIVFPEGTRKTDDDIVLQDFKSGIYHLARANENIEFIPVWLDNINRVLPKGKYLPVPLLCQVNIGTPLSLGVDEDKQAFLHRCRVALLALAPSQRIADAGTQETLP